MSGASPGNEPQGPAAFYGSLPENASRTLADVVVLGSGPGGSVTACLLAEAGRDVLLLEEGPLLDPASPEPFSSAEMQAKYRNRGALATLGAPVVAFAEGRCVGGGSEINSGLYHRTPPEALERWRREFGLATSGEDDLRPHFEADEHELSVAVAPPPHPPPSRMLEEGARRLGWKSLEVPRWVRFEEDASGAVRSVKQTMTRSYVPRAMRAGCTIAPGTRALRLAREAGRWRVRCARTLSDGTVRSFDVTAQDVFVACGAIRTPALLRKSGFRHNVGDALHLHPTVKVVAEFRDPVNLPGMGVPAHQVKEFAPRMSFGCSISAPPHLALALMDHPALLPSLPERWPRLVVYYAMTTGGRGSVRNLPLFRDPLVRYRLEGAELAELAEALRRLCRCLLAAGAVALYPCIAGSRVVAREDDLEELPRMLPRDGAGLMTIHAFSTCPMGERRERSAADSFGRVHDAPHLRIADASLLCDAPGVNPQGSIMAFARRNALHFLSQL